MTIPKPVGEKLSAERTSRYIAVARELLHTMNIAEPGDPLIARKVLEDGTEVELRSPSEASFFDLDNYEGLPYRSVSIVDARIGVGNLPEEPSASAVYNVTSYPIVIHDGHVYVHSLARSDLYRLATNQEGEEALDDFFTALES